MESLMDRIKEANNMLDLLSKEKTKTNNIKTRKYDKRNKTSKR